MSCALSASNCTLKLDLIYILCGGFGWKLGVVHLLVVQFWEIAFVHFIKQYTFGSGYSNTCLPWLSPVILLWAASVLPSDSSDQSRLCYCAANVSNRLAISRWSQKVCCGSWVVWQENISSLVAPSTSTARPLSARGQHSDRENLNENLFRATSTSKYEPSTNNRVVRLVKDQYATTKSGMSSRRDHVHRTQSLDYVRAKCTFEGVAI
ncbi:hypothetical protein BD289DRAFT_237680 [Coniella lustricola]|uniref:Uncharacterized protein n=1 Tax=Coniella lustricola TaxID=2025994 RepID=A0A2T3AL75_9PEZI|nr:hypothetical protein BD289DRAFT_237680 [Coniella lustricola]